MSCHFKLTPKLRQQGLKSDLALGTMYSMLEREAKEAGLALNWPRHLPNTRQALAAAEWARQHDPHAFPRVQKAFFTAHFQLGEDLEDPSVIDQHASDSGLDLRALHVALADGGATRAVEEAEKLGREHGVQGTPAWLFGQQLIMGLRSAAEFKSLAESALQLPR